jgi:hypothetical protein
MQAQQQVRDQEPGQKARHGTRFQPGQSGNPSGRMSRVERERLVRAKSKEIAAEFPGGWDRLGVVDRVRLEQAAILLVAVGKPRTQEEAVRRAHAIERLLGAVERRAGRREAPVQPVPVLTSLKLMPGDEP